MNLLFAFLKIPSTIPSDKSMSRTDYNTHTGDSVARSASRLSPDNSIMLGLACIDLGDLVVSVFETDKRTLSSPQVDRRSSR
jgi:hypothetical protein